MSGEMRHSGIEWIGDIPKDWKVIRAKGIFTQRSSKGNTTAVLLSATQKQGMLPQSMLEGVVQTNANTDLQTFKTVHKNDYVISLRSFQGGFEMSNYEGVCSPAYQVFYNKVPISHQFFWLLFKSYGFIDKINSLTVGIREGKNIQYKDFANMMLAVPSFSEQQRIADYLDKVCSEIDEMVGLQEKMIEELKAYKQSVITEAVTKGLNPNVPMRDIGIDWIGEIPEHWEVVKLSLLTTKIGSGSTPTGGANVYVSEGVKFLRSQNVYFEGLDLTDVAHITDEIDEEMKGTRVNSGDVLLNITGGSIGRCYFVDNTLGRANVNQHVSIIRPSRIATKYLKYYLQSEMGQNQITMLQTGGNREGLSAAALSKFKIVRPSVIEQQEIADFLDTKCADIDALIVVKQEKIDSLKEYKKSLIYEYVTGKKEIN